MPTQTTPFYCDGCEAMTDEPLDDYNERVCLNCQQNRAERAYERQCADFHAGDSGWPKTLLEQQAEARKFK